MKILAFFGWNLSCEIKSEKREVVKRLIRKLCQQNREPLTVAGPINQINWDEMGEYDFSATLSSELRYFALLSDSISCECRSEKQ